MLNPNENVFLFGIPNWLSNLFFPNILKNLGQIKFYEKYILQEIKTFILIRRNLK
jgi:hypothetical protein